MAGNAWTYLLCSSCRTCMCERLQSAFLNSPSHLLWRSFLPSGKKLLKFPATPLAHALITISVAVRYNGDNFGALWCGLWSIVITYCCITTFTCIPDLRYDYRRNTQRCILKRSEFIRRPCEGSRLANDSKHFVLEVDPYNLLVRLHGQIMTG